MYKCEKTQGIQRMILAIVKPFDIVKSFSFYIKSSLGRLDM